MTFALGTDGRTHDEAKVDVEEAAVGREHEVVVVAVAHAQDVGHHTVARAALHKRVQYLRFQAIRSCIHSCCQVLFLADDQLALANGFDNRHRRSEQHYIWLLRFFGWVLLGYGEFNKA